MGNERLKNLYLDTEPYGWSWDICEEWWPEGMWMGVCWRCTTGPLGTKEEIEGLCRRCERILFC